MMANSSTPGEVYLVIKTTEEKLDEFRAVNKIFDCDDDEAFNKIVEASKSILWDTRNADKLTEDGRKLYTIEDAHKFIGMQNFHPGVVYITYLTKEGSKQKASFTVSSYEELKKEWTSYCNKLPNVKKDNIIEFDIGLMPSDETVRAKMFGSLVSFLQNILVKDPSEVMRSGTAETVLAGMLYTDYPYYEEFFEAVLRAIGQTIEKYSPIATNLRYHGIGLPNLTTKKMLDGEDAIKVVSDRLE